MNKIISSNYERTKMADHILEMEGIVLFCDYCLLNTRVFMLNAANYFEVQSIDMFPGYLEAACKSYHKLPVHDSVS